MELEFSRQIFEIQIPDYMKICPVVAQLFKRTGGQTDRLGEANNRFYQFCKAA